MIITCKPLFITLINVIPSPIITFFYKLYSSSCDTTPRLDSATSLDGIVYLLFKESAANMNVSMLASWEYGICSLSTKSDLSA
jgi:hypothetical protein